MPVYLRKFYFTKLNDTKTKENEEIKKAQKAGKNSWSYGEIIKIFANATAVDAYNKMITDKSHMSC